HGGFQQLIVEGHVGAVVGFSVKKLAEPLVGLRFAGAEQAVDFQNLFGLGEREADGTIVPGVNQIVGLEGVDGVAAGGIALLLEAENYAGLDNPLRGLLSPTLSRGREGVGLAGWRHNGIKTQWRGFKQLAVGFNVLT